MAKNFNPSEFGIDFFSLDFFNFKELLNNNTFIVEGTINDVILYYLKYDRISNQLLINNYITPVLNLNSSYSYEFDISDESMKNIDFAFFNTNGEIFNKNIILAYFNKFITYFSKKISKWLRFISPTIYWNDKKL